MKLLTEIDVNIKGTDSRRRTVLEVFLPFVLRNGFFFYVPSSMRKPTGERVILQRKLSVKEKAGQ